MENQLLTATQKMNVQEFARYVASLTAAKITGIFLESHSGKLIPAMKNIHETREVETHEAGYTKQDITIASCCSECPDDSNMYVETILTESRFTDLIVIDAEMSFDKNFKGVLSAFTKAVLTKSECPVIIAPYSFYNIEEIIFAYDGSSSAVFAIKQFAYLFSALSDIKLTVLHVKSAENEPATNNSDILALLQMHYSNIMFRQLTGIAEEELFKYLAARKNAMVVMGAFGSQHLSPFSRHSTAEPLVKIINLPIFIAHQYLFQDLIKYA